MIAKKKPGDKSCVMFGCVDGKTAQQSPKCKQCAEINSELYKKCTEEGSILLNRSVRVDSNGKTIIGTSNKQSITKPLTTKKVTERGKKHMEPEKEKLEQTEKKKTEKKKTTVVRGGQTVGILETAKNFLLEGKSYNDVLQSLIVIYLGTGRNPQKAKHNAQSTVFNALKRLGMKKADNDLGYEKVNSEVVNDTKTGT